MEMIRVCGNCENGYIEGDKYCRFCGAPMGTPVYIEENYDTIYGPPPIQRKHRCGKCGYSWMAWDMEYIEKYCEKYCPQCGGEAPVVGGDGKWT